MKNAAIFSIFGFVDVVSIRHPIRLKKAWVATVRCTYPTPEAGTRTKYVQHVRPWEQVALCLRYVPNAGGWHA